MQYIYQQPLKNPPGAFWLILLVVLVAAGGVYKVASSFIFPKEPTKTVEAERPQIAEQKTIQDSSKTDDQSTTEIKSAESTTKVEEQTEAETVTLLPLFAADELTKHESSISGVSFTYPKSWTISESWGSTGVASGNCPTSALIFYPIILSDASIIRSNLLKDNLVLLSNLFNKGDNIQAVDLLLSNAPRITANLEGNICKTKVLGRAEVVSTGSFTIAKVAWVPEADYLRFDLNLTGIFGSYKIDSFSKVFASGGTKITLGYPDGWTPEEKEQSMVVKNQEREVLGARLQVPDPTNLDDAIDLFIGLQKDEGKVIDSSVTISSSSTEITDTTGKTWKVANKIFTFSSGKILKKAMVTAYHTSDLVDEVLISWKEATDLEWNAATAQLVQIEKTLEFSSETTVDSQTTTIEHKIPLVSGGSGFYFDTLAYQKAIVELKKSRWQEVLGYQKAKDPRDVIYFAPLSQLVSDAKFFRLDSGKKQDLVKLE